MKRYGWAIASLLGFGLLVPGVVADAPTLKVTVVSDVSEVEIEPGNREVVGLNVTLEFKEYPCAAGTKAGVDLVPPVAPPPWFGADPHPDGDTYASPKETKPATLTIVVAEDAPGSAEGGFRLKPIVHFPSSASCGGVEPSVDAPEFSVRVRTPPAASMPDADATDGADTPGPQLGLALALGLGLWLFRRRGQ